MDLLDRFIAQMAVVQGAWMPFLVALIVAGFAMWAFIRFIHGAKIDRLEQDVKSEQAEVGRLLNRVAEFERQMERTVTASRRSTPRALDQTAAPSARTEQSEAERVYLSSNVTPSFLVALRQGKTSIQALRAVEGYYGKWMTHGGTVEEVRQVDPRSIAVALETPNEDLSVRERMELTTLLFFSDDLNRIEALQRGDKIQVVGKLDSAAEFGIRLVDCELL